MLPTVNSFAAAAASGDARASARRRALARASAAWAVIATAALIGLGHARAEGLTGLPNYGFSASARADGSRTTQTAENGPIADTVVDPSVTTSAAALDTAGTSTAQADSPGLGDVVTGLPGTLAAGAPVYPLHVVSRYPATPQATYNGPGPSLTARSADIRTGATAVSVPASAPAGMTSSAVTDIAASAQGVVATATSTTRGFSIGPLKIGEVVTSAVVSRDAAGQLKRTVDVHVTGASVADQAVGITGHGLVVAGTTTPLPDSSPANSILQQAGITVTLASPVTTAAGARSPALLVRVAQNSPTDQSAQEVVHNLGVAEAEVATGQATPPAAQGPTAPGPAAPSGPRNGALHANTPGLDTPAATDTLPAKSASDVAPGIAPAAGSVTGGVPALAAAAAPGDWSSSFYLALVAASVATLVATTTIRVVAVRHPWI